MNTTWLILDRLNKCIAYYHLQFGDESLSIAMRPELYRELVKIRFPFPLPGMLTNKIPQSDMGDGRKESDIHLILRRDAWRWADPLTIALIQRARYGK